MSVRAAGGDRGVTPVVPRRGGQRGMVTIEAALVGLMLSILAVGCLWLAGAAFQLGHCQLTADEVARQHARGDLAAAERARADAPAGARTDVRHAAGQTVVAVSLDVRLGPWSLPVTAEARVIDELAP